MSTGKTDRDGNGLPELFPPSPRIPIPLRKRQGRRAGIGNQAALLDAAFGATAASSSHFTETNWETPGSCMVTP